MIFEETVIGYSVILVDPHGFWHWAVVDGTPAVFARRKDAIQFRDRLREHGLRVKGVVKVRMKLEVVNKEAAGPPVPVSPPR